MRRHKKQIVVFGSVCAVILAVILGLMLTNQRTSAMPVPNPHVWILARSALAASNAGTAAGLQQPGETVYEVINPTTCATSAASPLPGYVPTQHVFGYSRKPTIPAGTKAVLLDQEYWCQTPKADERDPVKYAAAGSQQAAAAGQTFITAPALDLFEAGYLPCSTRYWRCYLSSDLAGKMASVSNVIDIQAQSLEASTDGGRPGPHWDTFVSTAIAQAKAANPKVIVLVGVADTYTSSASVLETDLNYAFSHGASGAWLNESYGAQLMDSVLRHYGIWRTR
jgi:hypothetical protein